jgi:hypothetical protein
VESSFLLHVHVCKATQRRSPRSDHDVLLYMNVTEHHGLHGCMTGGCDDAFTHAIVVVVPTSYIGVSRLAQKGHQYPGILRLNWTAPSSTTKVTLNSGHLQADKYAALGRTIYSLRLSQM